MEGAELLQLPATQAGKVSCGSEGKSGIAVGGSLGKAEGRWRCSRAGHCRARRGDRAAPSGCKMSIAHAWIAPSGT